MNDMNTTGIAFIKVTSADTITVTQHVKSALGGVAWYVHNDTKDVVKVCVTNFKPKTTCESFQHTFHLAKENCTGSIDPDSIGVIAGVFKGKLGDVFTYDVAVNDKKAADPELEI